MVSEAKQKYWKEKFVTITESELLNSWGKYRFRLYEKHFYITRKSYSEKNNFKEIIISLVPHNMVQDILKMRKMDIRAINKMKSKVEFCKMMYNTFQEAKDV